VVVWEEGSTAFARTLGDMRTKCDACRVHADAIQRDFFAQVHAFNSRSK
jgi:hypothetical protein